eukprot:GFUD01031265.1.p1 GENE.GFUD01031265.1~~GFUD01031265.1.p1  ORF type:complete len:504 (-),score=175.14 GFUD01031265.1:59-1570(-)
MGRMEIRLTELERKQGEIQLKLDRLDKEDQGEERKRKDLGRERKVLLRELVDVKIRIRNLQRNRRKQVIVLGTSTCEETRPRDVDEIDDADAQSIDDLCDNFNPEALKLNTTRPEIRVYPKVPLPHSQPNWDKVVRVGRRRERPMVRWTDWEGQFTGVEEEEERSWHVSGGGRNWIRQDRHFSSRDEFGRWREAGKEFCAPDDLARFDELNPPGKFSSADVTSSDQKSHSDHFKVPVTNALAENLGTEQSSPPKAVSSTYPVQSLHPNCICYRPLHLVTCSSPSCGHSFYGRVATPCPTHPTDHYLMDHPTICPICKAGPIVEDRNLTLPQLLTQIKIKPVPGRKETTKSLIAQKSGLSVEEKGRWRINSKHTIESKKSVKYKDSQIFKKPQQSPRTVPHLTVQRHLLGKTGGGEHLTGRERKYLTSGQEVKEVEGAATKPVTTMLTSVKTKLVTTRKDAASVLSSPVVNMALVLPCEDQGTLRERLRKRLILSKSGGQRGEK